MNTLLLLLPFLLLGDAVGTESPEADELENLPQPKNAIWQYFAEHALDCSAPLERLAEPLEWKLGEKAFLFDGVRLFEKEPSDGTLTVGVLGAVKDFMPETRESLGFFLKRFQEEKVDFLVLLGDIGSTEYEIMQVVSFCARSGPPLLAVSGNSESRAAFNRALLGVQKRYHQVVNANLVQRVDTRGMTLLFLGGYFERRFAHETAACIYRKEQLEQLSNIAKSSAPTRLLFSHGPPLGKGGEALDAVPDGDNVGDPALNRLMQEAEINFGIFSHILEAGGVSSDAQGKLVPEDKMVERLWLNVGSANPLPWQLNSGAVSCGMAAVVKVQQKRASYKIIKHSCRRTPAP
jgi:Icc-related predicted phosphoesterase